MLGGPSNVAVTREDRADAIVLRAAHDGYADRYGIVHERTILLAADGTRLDGEDMFLAADGSAQVRTADDHFAVRFHLHPSVKATRLTDGHGVMLMTPNKEVWTFSAHEDRVELEDSVYLAGSEGPRRTTQMVIHGHARTTLARAVEPSSRPPRRRSPPPAPRAACAKRNRGCRCNLSSPLKGGGQRGGPRPNACASVNAADHWLARSPPPAFRGRFKIGGGFKTSGMV